MNCSLRRNATAVAHGSIVRSLNATINDNGIEWAQHICRHTHAHRIPYQMRLQMWMRWVQMCSRRADSQPASWWLACRIVSISISIPLTHRRKLWNLKTVITFSIDFRQSINIEFSHLPVYRMAHTIKKKEHSQNKSNTLGNRLFWFEAWPFIVLWVLLNFV